ncbi:flagellar hook-associated protein FlgK [Rhodopila sp.]|uniref:flagellar hook-associated protein FlgK n=1 Tax=Rhodopila sp. TaxID=2480087 RepID=UPI003D13C087
MGLDSALSIATGGLANISAQFALVSQNVANAGTPAYAVESSAQQDITADGQGLGVRTGPATIQVDQALQASLQQQNATVTGLTTTQTALQSIDSVLGTVGQGNDLGSLLGTLQNQFSTLLTDPSSQTQQSTVVGAAATLASGINNLSQAYSAQSQAVQNDLVSAVGTLNTTLSTIGQLNTQIIAAQQAGRSTADLQNQQNAAVQTLSGLTSIKTIQQPNGGILLVTTGGLSLPTNAGTTPFSIAGGSANPGAYYPGGGLPGVMLGGTDVTGSLTDGRIGADLTLRDQTLPTGQAELDEFSANLSSRFAGQGLSLFTDPAGNVPSGGGTPVQAGYVGYAATIQVNPQITANAALVRDGTTSITGSPTGASAFTPNPAGGPAGFTTLISRVINNTFGNDVQTGVAQPVFNTAGLGAGGTLSAPFGSASSLADYATDMIAAQSQQSAATSGSLTNEQAVQTGLVAQVTAQSGVNIDTELSNMISLQNAYQANAHIIAAVQSMFSQLLTTVGTGA